VNAVCLVPAVSVDSFDATKPNRNRARWMQPMCKVRQRSMAHVIDSCICDVLDTQTDLYMISIFDQ